MILNQSKFSRVLSSLRKQHKLLILVLLFLPSCASRHVKDIISEKHASSYVFRQRLIDNDPNNDPTVDQLKKFVIATSKDWESMDIMLNGWKPNENMNKIDLGK